MQSLRQITPNVSGVPETFKHGASLAEIKISSVAFI